MSSHSRSAGRAHPREGWLRRQVISTLPLYLLASSISHWLIRFILSFTYWPYSLRTG